jgi:hypothetical protein
MAQPEHICPVCGYELAEPAWVDDVGGSFEICDSCGIQFGYEDAAGDDRELRAALWGEWRAAWVANGMPWRGVGRPPDDFDPGAQLARLADSP